MFAVSGALASMLGLLMLSRRHRPCRTAGLAMSATADWRCSSANLQQPSAKDSFEALVIRNDMLNQSAWEQMMFSQSEFAASCRRRFAAAAEAWAPGASTVQSFGELDGIMDQAFAADGPWSSRRWSIATSR